MKALTVRLKSSLSKRQGGSFSSRMSYGRTLKSNGGKERVRAQVSQGMVQEERMRFQ